MTLILGLIDRGCVWLGGDSCTSVGEACVLSPPKVWRQGPFVIGVCGSQWYESALCYRVRWPSAPPADLGRFVLCTLGDELASAARAAGVDTSNDDGPASGGAIIGVGGTLWELRDFVGSPIVEPYAASGSAWESGLAALLAMQLATTRHARAERRLLRAFEATARHRRDVRGPFHFVHT